MKIESNIFINVFLALILLEIYSTNAAKHADNVDEQGCTDFEQFVGPTECYLEPTCGPEPFNASEAMCKHGCLCRKGHLRDTETLKCIPQESCSWNTREKRSDFPCGVFASQRLTKIVGGDEVVPHAIPYQALVYDVYLCGASVIQDQFLLSAAHCFGSNQNKATAVLGSHEIFLPGPGGQIIEVNGITIHPGYDPWTLKHDIAVLKLKEPITFNNVVRKICLPKKIVSAGQPLTATGWGNTEENGNLAQFLQSVTVPKVVMNICNGEDGYDGIVQNKFQICAGEAGKDTCQGDSGGPLARQRPDGKWEQQGITSWGFGCALENYPGVYTKVIKYRQWIQKTMNAMLVG